MQTKAAAEGRLHSGPTGRVSVVVEGGISPQRAQLAGPTDSLNSSDQLQHGDVDRGVKRFVRQSVQHSQIGTISQLLAGGVAGAVSKTCTAPLARLTILFQKRGSSPTVQKETLLSHLWKKDADLGLQLQIQSLTNVDYQTPFQNCAIGESGSSLKDTFFGEGIKPI